jgi:hypothetical protein
MVGPKPLGFIFAVYKQYQQAGYLLPTETSDSYEQGLCHAFMWSKPTKPALFASKRHESLQAAHYYGAFMH